MELLLQHNAVDGCDSADESESDDSELIPNFEADPSIEVRNGEQEIFILIRVRFGRIWRRSGTDITNSKFWRNETPMNPTGLTQRNF